MMVYLGRPETDGGCAPSACFSGQYIENTSISEFLGFAEGMQV